MNTLAEISVGRDGGLMERIHQKIGRIREHVRLIQSLKEDGAAICNQILARLNEVEEFLSQIEKSLGIEG